MVISFNFPTELKTSSPLDQTNNIKNIASMYLVGNCAAHFFALFKVHYDNSLCQQNDIKVDIFILLSRYLHEFTGHLAEGFKVAFCWLGG